MKTEDRKQKKDYETDEINETDERFLRQSLIVFLKIVEQSN
jgi:hypothetical protein